MKIIRLFKILAAFSSLSVLLLLAAVLGAPYLIQTENIRSQATKLITQWSDGQIRIHGPIKLTTFMSAALTAEQIEFDQGRDHGPVKRVSAKALRIELSMMNLMRGKLKFKELALVEPQIEIQVPQKPLSLAFAEQFHQHPLFAIIKRSSLYDISIENGVVDARYEGVSHRFSQFNGYVLFNRKSDRFMGNAEFEAGGYRQAVSFNAYRPNRILRSSQDYNLQYKFENQLAEVKFSGTINPSGQLKIRGRQHVHVHDVSGLARWLGMNQYVKTGIHTVSLDAAMDVDGAQANFSDAYISLDENSAYGTLGVKLGAKPLIDGTLAFTQLSLAPYIQKGSIAGVTKSGKKISAFDLLRSFDADLRISANRIVSPYLSANNSALMISVRSNKLMADIVDTEICDGTAYGRLEIDADAPSPALSLDGSLVGVSTDNCLNTVITPGLMSGRASADVHLTASGASWKSVLGSLQGKWSLNMPSGGQVNMDLPYLFSDPGQKNVTGWKMLADGATSFDKLNITSNLANGTATINTLLRASERQNFAGQGRVNLVESHMDYMVTMASTAPPLLPSKASTKAKELRLTGPWNAPEFSWNEENAKQQR